MWYQESICPLRVNRVTLQKPLDVCVNGVNMLANVIRKQCHQLKSHDPVSPHQQLGFLNGQTWDSLIHSLNSFGCWCISVEKYIYSSSTKKL